MTLALRGLEPKTTVPLPRRLAPAHRAHARAPADHHRSPTGRWTAPCPPGSPTARAARRQEHPRRPGARHGTGPARRPDRPQPRPHQRLAAPVPARRRRTRRPPRLALPDWAALQDPRRRPWSPAPPTSTRAGATSSSSPPPPPPASARSPAAASADIDHDQLDLDRAPPDHHLARRPGRQGHQGQARPHRAPHPRGPAHGRTPARLRRRSRPTAGCSSDPAAAGSPPRSCATPPTGTTSSPGWATSGCAATDLPICLAGCFRIPGPRRWPCRRGRHHPRALQECDQRVRRPVATRLHGERGDAVDRFLLVADVGVLWRSRISQPSEYPSGAPPRAVAASGSTGIEGKPTCTAGALSAPRSGSGAAAHRCSAAIPTGGRILHQMQSGGDRPWSGSCRARPPRTARRASWPDDLRFLARLMQFPRVQVDVWSWRAAHGRARGRSR